ncbi:Cap protein [Porcine stool-associated circular virus 3]|uniref:Cap protein n=1 Tax=Porcine stool-associated circular virus 3 TaxID=1328032 RepID=N0ABG9_9VIRU|nr:Cap protein [Porcine stool-associated circular virus 3]
MKVKFTQFFDISSSSEGFTTFKVVAGGDYVKQRCMPQFLCYKYYKLGPVSVKLVPASTLPVDPTGLSYATGENTVDPRDMFNPGLVRITTGEFVDTVSSMDTYYATLLDPRWFKFQLQQGFSRYARPLVYNIGEIHQDPVGLTGQSIPDDSGINSGFDYYDVSGQKLKLDSYSTNNLGNAISYSPIQTGRIKLGWMPTDTPTFTNGTQAGGLLSFVPEVDVITFVLPKAFKTKFYYRVFVESTVYFKDPVAINPIVAANGKVAFPMDRFVGLQAVNGGSLSQTWTNAQLGYHYKEENEP